ncbi:MAG: hypothetical protein E4G99_11510 [Anaerolineales bacterium]|nr:MAG: hypothetical protein E4G99_11510 [Anaerolineales bacterium]
MAKTRLSVHENSGTYITNKSCLILIIFLLLSACQPMTTDPGPDECQDAIGVVVWADLNANGERDPEEPPISDVLLMLAPRDDPASGNIQLTTGQNGQAHFPARELTDCSPAGYAAVFPRQVAGYQFPANPVIALDDFNPDLDKVEFGLVPESNPVESAPPVQVSGCDIVSEEEIINVIGALGMPPERFATTGEEVGSFDGCMYVSEAFAIFIVYGPSPGISAQDYFDRILTEADPESVEILSGVGQEAIWVPESSISGSLNILLSDLVLSISVNGESPLAVAQQVAPYAFERIP